MMATLTLTNEQAIDLFKQLPLENKEDVLLMLAREAAAARTERMAYAEAQMRRVCAERGLDWDQMSEQEREDFVDDLIHEDRECNR
jgi:hypothetical protein